MKLNLGCGKKILPGYINCDNFSQAGQNLDTYDGVTRFDLTVFPWPFSNESVDEILMVHVLEHLPDLVATMAEIGRILKPGGIFHGEVPYGANHGFQMTCWQHVRAFVPATFTLSMAHDFPDFKIQARACVWSNNWKQKLRNLIPFREVLAEAGWGMAYDVIKFRMVKL